MRGPTSSKTRSEPRCPNPINLGVQGDLKEEYRDGRYGKNEPYEHQDRVTSGDRRCSFGGHLKDVYATACNGHR